MNFLKTLLFSTFFLGCFTMTLASNDWGKTGHRAVGEIAQDYLNGKTKRKIAELLDGQSLAFVSTFGDDIKSDRAFDKYYTWHYVNMPFDVNYENSNKNPEGDLVTAIEKCKSVILDEAASKQDKIFHLKLLVHFIGDLHQPMHVGRVEDRGGNDVKVSWFRNETNLHAVWDSKMIDHFQMSYMELAKNTNKLSKRQVKSLQKGSTVDWVNETHKHAISVYKSVEKNENIGYGYMYSHFSLLRSQLQKGGIRLAGVLNDLFK